MVSITRPRRRRRTAAAVALAALSCGVCTISSGAAMAADVAPSSELGYDPTTAKGSLWHIAETVGAHDLYRAGITGKGVGIALIDTGVSEVRGLDTGNVVHGPDLSFDSQDPQLAHKDAFGHGTHLASVIAGRDAAGAPASYVSETDFNGIAPDATLISVKVGASDGAVDVTQVIAGIDWVVEHRKELNIRVLNLSYGTDSDQDPLVDPLSHAVEQAWEAGILVVVAGGNDGVDTETLAQPAQNPTVLAVGADDTAGTVSTSDDLVPTWVTGGSEGRHVDLVAPGVSVLGTRVPQGYADQFNPQARTGTRFARASGTSQAAAVVSGAAALLLQRDPKMTPAQVKGQLMSTADPLDRVEPRYAGHGLLDVAEAARRNTGGYKDPRYETRGTGTLEGARGSSHVYDGVSELRGEVDIFGNPWQGPTWASSSAKQKAWVGGSWCGTTWSGDGWDARTWRDVIWPAGTWSARTWRGDDWSARTWRDGSWTGEDWSARTWRDADWSARTWRHTDLASTGWLARTWA
jgi:serine protease AprX